MDPGRKSSVGIVFPAYQESPFEIIESQSYSAISQGYGDINQHGADNANHEFQNCCCKDKSCKHCYRIQQPPSWECCSAAEDEPRPVKVMKPVERSVEEPLICDSCCIPPKDEPPRPRPVKPVKQVQKDVEENSTCCSCCMPPKVRRTYLVIRPENSKSVKYQNPVQEEIPMTPIANEDPSYPIDHSMFFSPMEAEKSTDVISSHTSSPSPRPEPSEVIRFEEESHSVLPQQGQFIYSKRFLGQFGNEMIRSIFPLYIPNEQRHSKLATNNFDEIKKEYDGTTIDSINNQLRECAKKVEYQEKEGDNFQSDDDSIKRYCHIPHKHFINKQYSDPEAFNQSRPAYEKQYKNNAKHYEYDEYEVNQRNKDANRINNLSWPNNQHISRNAVHKNDNEKTFNYVKNIFNTLTDWIKHYPSPENPTHFPHESNEFQSNDQVNDQFFKIEVCETPCGKETLIINKC